MNCASYVEECPMGWCKILFAYLWHWPAFVALVFLDVQAEPLAIILGVVLAILLANLSYAFVEQPRQGLARLGLRWGRPPWFLQL